MSKEVTSTLIKFNKDYKWFLQNREKLLYKYENKWVAIQNQKVLDSNENLTKLIEKLKAKGLPPEQILIQYVSKKPIEAIL